MNRKFLAIGFLVFLCFIAGSCLVRIVADDEAKFERQQPARAAECRQLGLEPQIRFFSDGTGWYVTGCGHK